MVELLTAQSALVVVGFQATVTLAWWRRSSERMTSHWPVPGYGLPCPDLFGDRVPGIFFQNDTVLTTLLLPLGKLEFKLITYKLS